MTAWPGFSACCPQRQVRGPEAVAAWIASNTAWFEYRRITS
jgi:hypothetical protein